MADGGAIVGVAVVLGSLRGAREVFAVAEGARGREADTESSDAKSVAEFIASRYAGRRSATARKRVGLAYRKRKKAPTEVQTGGKKPEKGRERVKEGMNQSTEVEKPGNKSACQAAGLVILLSKVEFRK